MWKPNSIWCYDFTHFPRAGCAAIAVMDLVSRRWLTTLISAEESSTQVEIAFTDALLDVPAGPAELPVGATLTALRMAAGDT